MELSLLCFFLALVTIVSAFTLPIDETLMATDNETTLMARDDPVTNIGILFEGLSYFTGFGDPCGHNKSVLVFNELADTKFSPSCQRLYDALNAYSSDKNSKTTVSVANLVYLCPPKVTKPTGKGYGWGDENPKLVISGPDKFPDPAVPLDVELRYWVPPNGPDFTLPATIEYEYSTQTKEILRFWSISYIHCK